jgi:hypothetical protein
MLIAHGAIVLFLVALGLVFLSGKGAFLIAGYNTADEDEKRKIDEVALCKFMGKSMFSLAACWLILGVGSVLDNMIFVWTGIGLFFAMVVSMVVYANTGNRFRK